MAANTVVYSLSAAAYTDVSGGYESCAFRIPWKAQKDNAVRVHLGVSLPAADTTNFDVFEAPAEPPLERSVRFNELDTADRVYVRAVAGTVSLAVYRK